MNGHIDALCIRFQYNACRNGLECILECRNLVHTTIFFKLAWSGRRSWSRTRVPLKFLIKITTLNWIPSQIDCSWSCEGDNNISSNIATITTGSTRTHLHSVGSRCQWADTPSPSIVWKIHGYEAGRVDRTVGKRRIAFTSDWL